MRMPYEPSHGPGTSGQPLIPELGACRSGFLWAKDEIRSVTAGLDDERFNRRPGEGRWSAAECVAHLNATAAAAAPRLGAAIREARARGLLAAGPFRYGRLGEWFVRQTGGDELPPRRRYRAPRRYRPPQKRFELGPSVREFVAAQGGMIELLQLASGVDLARVKVASPVSPLLRLGLGQWFRMLAGHQRRHLWQAREALALVREEPSS